MTPAAFAIPGDLRTRTGGYIYESRLLEALRSGGREVRHLTLPASFPDPTEADMATALGMLARVPVGCPLILDGFLSGTLQTEGLAQLRAPLCAMVHHPLGLESGLSGSRAEFLLRRERENLALMHHVLVPSPHTAATLTARFGVSMDRITIAPPGSDPVREKPRQTQPPLLLAIGILHPRKGHDVLLEALARIIDLEWQAVIVGGTYDVSHAAALHARAAEPDLRGRVRLTGELGDHEVHELYRSATIMTLATRYEGYGMVFGEAQRHGLPVVSCSAGAVPDTVPQDAGVLVPPDDPAAFARALCRVLTEDKFRLSLASGSARRGRALPTWDATARVAGAVLDRMAAG